MMANLKSSVQIFNQLMNGKVINRDKIDNDAYKANPLFTEIMDNLKEYEHQYEMCGFNFINTEKYVYITDQQQSEDLKTDIGMKAQILLLMIGKYLNSKNLSISRITTLSAGITHVELEDIQSMEETVELLERAGLKENFKDNVKNILVDRNILLEKTTSQSYVLSAIGEAFFEELKPLYSQPQSEHIA